MSQKAKFEIYESLTSRKKKYAVVPENHTIADFEAAVKYMKKVNHCSSNHIVLASGYILNGMLYFNKPENKKARYVYVFTYVR